MIIRYTNRVLFSSDNYSVMEQHFNDVTQQVIIYVRLERAHTFRGENAQDIVQEYHKLYKELRGDDPDDNFQAWRWNKTVFHPFFAKWVERHKTIKLALQALDLREHTTSG